MKTGNIGIGNLVDIGISDVDVYGTDRRKKNSLFEFKGTVQFYRSKSQANGVFGKENINEKEEEVKPEYNGQFGFDSYNKDYCPMGSVIYYNDKNGRSIEDKNYSGYVSSFLSIWPPKKDKDNNVILYVKADDNSRAPELLEYECKEWSKDSKSFTILSKKLNITKLNTENISGINYFKINVQCTESFENDISIIAKYNENIAGRIIIKANSKVYETIIQPVLINFGTTASTTIQQKEHEKFVKDLANYFNENSFNQAYVKGKIADKTHIVTFLKSDFTKGDVIIEQQDEYDECRNLCKGGLFVNYTEDNQKKAIIYNTLVEERYAAYGSGSKEKQEAKEKLEEAMIKLIKEFKKKFKYSDTNDLKKAKKFFEDKKVTVAWNETKVQEAYNNYKTLKEKYKGDVFLDKKNTIFFFINKDIEGGRTAKEKAQAYSMTDSGVGHVFSSAYKDKDAASLIIHELGHGFGLRHTFFDPIQRRINNNNTSINNLQNEIQKLEKNKSTDLKDFVLLDSIYLDIQEYILTPSETNTISIRTFEERFIAYLTGKYSYYDEKGEYHEYTDTNLLDLEKNNTNDKNIQKLIDGKNKEIKKLKDYNEKNKDRTGIVANQSKTLENMMDYRQPQGATCITEINPKFKYKSFYQWQWQKIIELGNKNSYLSEIK